MATLAFAASGLIEAARKRMDAVGIGVVASVAAFGGGTLRDLLLDRRPLFWVDNVELLWLVLGLTLLAIVFLRSRHLEITERAMLWPDAIGLGLFCAVGTQIALELEMPLLVAAVMGVITAIFGGVLRDMVCNEIPRVLSDHRPYAICAFIGAWVLIAADRAGFEDWASLLLAAVVASSLRLIAVKLDWELPRWRD
ncbi:trimeric intracellular cation channel family protein [Ectothiorhodosinus mongolicus]|nr:trimeric intracellular cation channel family protein [Ectothiorhodosinus mongolicus]